jgi:uncharacterized protein YciI
MDCDTYSFVLLRRGRRAHEYDDDEEVLERLQAQHLAHLDAMRERGALLAAGPFTDQEDETFRGLCVYRTGLAETRELAESDPSVQAGRMRVEVMRWLTKPGAVAFPGSIDDRREDA